MVHLTDEEREELEHFVKHASGGMNLDMLKSFLATLAQILLNNAPRDES